MPPSSRQQTVQISVPDGAEDLLSPEALEFVTALHRRFGARRKELLQARRQIQQQLEDGTRRLGFRPDTLHIREAAWRIDPIPEALQRRVVEITGPVDRKMMINAFNSGADVFMADFEDSHSPIWQQTLDGQRNVRDAVAGTLSFEDPKTGRRYEVGPDPALLVVRVRGLHLEEPAVQIDGEPVSAALLDFALSFFHNAHRLAERGEGPFYYLPKLEHMEEARWWADVFTEAENKAGLANGTVKATILIETLPAVFEMDEILHGLRHHIAGLNAGRWDYIFSCIKTRPHEKDAVLPDRSQVTMDVPFMKCYSELLVKSAHRRGAYAMGGMSAVIPSRDPARNEAAFAAVMQDKHREARAGFDGTWVAHPGLVDVARAPFERILCGSNNQLHRLRGDVEGDAFRLLDFHVDDGRRTEEGLSRNLEVCIRYLDAWLAGRGAVAIHGLMEDAATAEIARTQVWQWLRHAAPVEGAPLTRERVQTALRAVAAPIVEESDDPGRSKQAATIVEEAVLADDLPEFLILQAQSTLPSAGTKNTRSAQNHVRENVSGNAPPNARPSGPHNGHIGRSRPAAPAARREAQA